jgi:predicted nucleic acid-binding protein
VGLSPARWLIDKSALYRINHPEVAEVLREHLAAGRVGGSMVTGLEMGYSAHSASDYRETRQKLIEHRPGSGMDRAPGDGELMTRHWF